jgi:hypothetical protein
MVSGAKDEKRQKYTLGKSRKNGEKQLTKNSHSTLRYPANEKYSSKHWAIYTQ